MIISLLFQKHSLYFSRYWNWR